MVIVPFAPLPLMFSVTVPAGTLVSVNCPWPLAVVLIPVPATVIVMAFASSSANPLAVIGAAVTVFTWPEIVAPLLLDAPGREGATGDNDALPAPPHAAVSSATQAAITNNFA